MHNIEPYYNWYKYYDQASDENSPYFGKIYDFDQYKDAIYGYYIDPAWDYIGSETLYIKILFADYQRNFMIIEFIGEWNDALHNDIMYLKRNIIDHFLNYGINKFILIGENVLNFHGSDDCYYEEWFDETSDGWIAAISFRDFVLDEWKKYKIDCYINFGGSLQIDNWRTHQPVALFNVVDRVISRRISLM
jgi:hypothetical protein